MFLESRWQIEYDYAKYAEYTDYAEYAEYTEYAEYADYAEYAEYIEYAEYGEDPPIWIWSKGRLWTSDQRGGWGGFISVHEKIFRNRFVRQDKTES